MSYFNECSDIAQVRARFRELSKIAHPDSGGSHELFVRLQESYAEALKIAPEPRSQPAPVFAPATVKESLREPTPEPKPVVREPVQKEADDTDRMAQRASLITSGTGATVERVGTWIWVTGNLKPYPEVRRKLGKKGLGFFYNGKRKVWQWKPTKGRYYSSPADNATVKGKYGARAA